MRKLAAVVLMLATVTGAGAQTQRNPTGTSKLGGPTRGPTGASASPAPSQPRDTPLQTPAAATRPALGSAGASAGPTGTLNQTAPGHTIGVGPNTFGGNTGTGLEKPPNALGASTAAGGALPQGNANIRPNGGTAASGSKPAPMQANGVRKVE